MYYDRSINNKRVPLLSDVDKPEREVELSMSVEDKEPGPDSSVDKKPGGGGVYYKASSDKTKFCGCFCLMPTKPAKYLEIILLIVILILVILLSLLPIALHINEEVKEASNNDTSAFTPVSSQCPSYGASSCTAGEDDGTVSNTSCKPVQYTGSTCQTYLQTWQSCTIGTSSNLYISSSPDQKTLKDQASEVLKLLQSPVVSKDCKTAGSEFVCQYSFPLCDCVNNKEYLPSSEFCTYVSTDVCGEEWELAMSIPQIAQALPDCSKLPSGGGHTPGNTSGILSNGTITCSDEFYNSNGFCRPECGKFLSFSPKNALIQEVSQLIAAIIGLTLGIAVLIAIVIQWRVLLTFPSIFVLYMTIVVCTLSLFIIISVADYKDLFCSSKDLVESFYHPTIYCKVIGAVFQYFFLNLTLWWFFHLISAFYKIMFPTFFQEHKSRNKYIHIVLIILGVFLPLPAVLLTLFDKSLGSYTLFGYPSYVCVPRNSDMLYYSIILPLNILLGAGLFCLVLMCWRLNKHRRKIILQKSSLITPVELKLLFSLVYYIIFGGISLVYFGIATATQDDYAKLLTNYFECEAFGVHPNVSCDTHREFKKYNYQGLSVAVYMLMGFISTSNLIYVINWKALVHKTCYRKKYSKAKKLETSAANDSE